MARPHQGGCIGTAVFGLLHLGGPISIALLEWLVFAQPPVAATPGHGRPGRPLPAQQAPMQGQPAGLATFILIAAFEQGPAKTAFFAHAPGPPPHPFTTALWPPPLPRQAPPGAAFGSPSSPLCSRLHPPSPAFTAPCANRAAPPASPAAPHRQAHQPCPHHRALPAPWPGTAAPPGKTPAPARPPACRHASNTASSTLIANFE